MPAKNAGDFITECIKSIQQQTFQNWELIIVNDNSTDSTSSIINSFKANDQRIQLIKSEGIGIIPALQTAINACVGLYVTRIDADDIMPADRLYLMIASLKEAGPKAIITGKVKYFSDNPISDGYVKYERWLNDRVNLSDHWKWIYRECVIASPNWMAHRKNIVDFKFFETLKYPEDYDLVLKWYSTGFKVYALSEVTLQWREHSQRISRLSDQYGQKSFFELKLRHFIDNELNTDHELLIWGTNKKGKLTASLLITWGIQFRWMSLLPSDDHQEIYNKEIEHFEAKSDRSFQLLITVYPEPKELKKLYDYLDSRNLEMGLDYWFL